ncbi:DUF262 domain-containing protein [Variovorax sp. J22P240]|uniref:DUF262 domain-containing protein n=1 Tax=Variovorax sp. J22P240 TaxID=3053514 RepID=UPI002575C418|nr:DUF262 domain-containing protein [Variovorax sp. J22P240]MDM0002707.1 DUF262 domain-containing protein [Variovorax sp. J22P240]
MSTDFADLEIETEDEDEEVSVVYDIATYPSDFTLAGIAQMWKDGDIEIPDFQREFVWTIKQSSVLIDSFLCGLPVPPVFFYIDEKNKNLVIDGQQRILSVVFFMEGYFGEESTQGKRVVFRLSGLESKSPYYNKRFVDLDEVDQRKLKQSVLRAVNIRQLNPTGEGTSAYHIFERLNTGGTPLKPQEIRNCVFRGALGARLKEANQDKSWRKILGKKTIDKHQRDVEIILRIFGLAGASDKYEKPMKEYLNAAMKKHVDGRTKKSEQFFEVFPKACELIAGALGEKPFHLRGPLNVSALDGVMCVVIENLNNIDPSELSIRYKKLLGDPEFRRLTLLATTDTNTLQARVKLAREVLIG